MTRRFDRLAGGEKLHMQSFCALAHFDFNHAGAYSCEQALLTIRQLNLPMAAVEEQFRRMAFNIIARNQDDHVKNIAFLMDREGRWSLAPALLPVYAPAKGALVEASNWGLLLAISALGLGTSAKAILTLGWRHMTIVVGSVASPACSAS